MTEAEWLECKDPQPMLEFLKGKATDRKLRLCACALGRRLWPLLTDPRSRQAVAVSECYADGLVGKDELYVARNAAREVVLSRTPGIDLGAARMAIRAATRDGDSEGDAIVWYTVNDAYAIALQAAVSWDCGEVYGPARQPGIQAEQDRQALLLREVFSNPFRPITLDPTWATPAIVHLALSLYEERRFEDMPVLADALEEAGCQDAAVLEHCRGPGPHVRGCWVIDLVLGKG
jgi:hypothetical protein